MAHPDFTWIPFYRELAEKLLTYKTDRPSLIGKIRQVYEATGIRLPTLESDNTRIPDMDPFTVFSLFNRRMTNNHRYQICQGFRDVFNINQAVPETFDGIPIQNFTNYCFYCFVGDSRREETCFDTLWELFEAGIHFSESTSRAFAELFSRAVNLPMVGVNKLTIGLFYISPEHFVSLDSFSRQFIRERYHMEVSIPENRDIQDSMQGNAYLHILSSVDQRLRDDETIHTIPELVLHAYETERSLQMEREEQEEKKEPVVQEAVLSENPESYGKAEFEQAVYAADFDTWSGLLERKRNIILQGAPGVGKTFAARRLAYAMMGKRDDRHIGFVQFHQNYSYEDFVMGYRPDQNGFSLKDGVFKRFCEMAEKEPEGKFFFIIDEINRGNISKIFGELLMAIEKDHRGETVTLSYQESPFSVPDNLYIIGMMNTADRSLAIIDYALRRRFSFIDMKPAFESNGFRQYRESLTENFGRLIDEVQELNRCIADDESLGEGFCIGHSYFCGIEPENCSDALLHSIVDYEILPLLSEYWFDDRQKIGEWKRALGEAIR